MKITVAGIGYVGLANAVLLSRENDVTALDVVAEKVDMLNRRQSPLEDAEIKDYLAHKQLRLTATTDGAAAYRDAGYVIVSTPANYEPALREDSFFGSRVIWELEEFRNLSQVIVANRYSKELEPVKEKVYTRDLYFRD